MKYGVIVGVGVVIGIFILAVIVYMDNAQMNDNQNSIMQKESIDKIDSMVKVKDEDEMLANTSEVMIDKSDGPMTDDSIEEPKQVFASEEVGTTKDEKSDSMKEMQSIDAPSVPTQTMLVAGGCFWCVEADLEKLPGVIEVVSGYAEGTNENPTYQNYKENGHREVAEVTYNPSVVSFEEILIMTIKHTDPTDDDGSFFDRGDSYSTALYYENEAQKKLIDDLIVEIDEFGPYEKPLAIDVLERPKFWKAEEYHQDYYKKGISKLKYKFYRNRSGRDDFIEKNWSVDTSPSLPWRSAVSVDSNNAWDNFIKPSDDVLKQMLTALQFKVTQKNGTERPFKNEYWDNKDDGIYVDIVSGEPLFSSTNKFDSGTGWPSFTRPIEYSMVTERDDYVLLQKRIEVRSKIADSHLGHIFNDAPKELGGIRYCINSAALRFVPKEEMEIQGYGVFSKLFR